MRLIFSGALIAAFAILLLDCAPASAFSCKRHIYNNSDCAWTFSADTRNGNVYFNTSPAYIQSAPPQTAGTPMTNYPKSTPSAPPAAQKSGTAQTDIPACVQSCTTQNGPCTVTPRCRIEIEYTTRSGMMSGKMTIASPSGDARTWDYENKSVADTCPYVRHSGRTGGVSMNEPADGDFTVEACAW